MTEYTFQFIEKNYTVEAVIPGAFTASGASGASASLRSTGTAVGAVSALKAVASVQGGFAEVNLNNVNHCGVVAGVAYTAAASGASFLFISSGEMIDSSWNWSLFLPVFIAANGSLTQTCPSGVMFIQQIGTPSAATKLIIRPGQPMLLQS